MRPFIVRRKILGQELEEAALHKDEHPMELLELGETMVTKYIKDAAPLIQPAAVESKVSGVIGGVKVSGYVDLLDIEGRIIDSKSALKPLKGVTHDVRDDSADFGMYVRRSTAVQCVATKAPTKYPFQLFGRVYWVFDGSREIRAYIIAIRLRPLYRNLRLARRFTDGRLFSSFEANCL